jgi:hypothetical protein
MSRRALVVWCLALLATVASADEKASSVSEYLAGVTGKALFLKVDVLRVQRMLSGQDATNIDRDGKVYYRAHVGGFRSSQATSAEDFANEAREQARQGKQADLHVRSWNRGAPVTIEKATVNKDEIELDVKMTKGGSKIRFKFDDNQPWGIEDVERLFHVAFAETEAELQGAQRSVDIAAGMSTDDVIAKKGAPKTRVSLGTKTILTYDDMKLVFENDKLVDVQ